MNVGIKVSFNKKVIVLLSDDFYPHCGGGAGRIAWELAREYAKKFEVHIITCGEHLSYVEDGVKVHVIRRAGYNVRWQNWWALYNPRSRGVLRSYLKAIKPDIVHIHNVHRLLSWSSIRVCRKMGFRVVVTLHDCMSFVNGKYIIGEDTSLIGQFKRDRLRFNPLRNLAIRYFLGFADKVVAVSNKQMAYLMAHGIRVDNMIHNGLDVTRYDRAIDYSWFLKKHGLRNKGYFLFAGRVSDMKGVNLAKDCAGWFGLPLVVAGGSGESDEKVKYVGWLGCTELQAAYAGCLGVLVLSKNLDASPTVILEAKLMGVPVAVSMTVGDTAEGDDITIERCAAEYYKTMGIQ